MSGFALEVNLGDFFAVIDDTSAAVDAAARPAAQAAVQVLYDAVKVNVAALGKVTGNLDRAIYQAFSADNSAPGRATYHVSWNAKKAPHGGLVEFGHIQRYKVYMGSDGKWYTAIRPDMIGKPKPSRRASQEVKDAYYVPLPAPKQVAASSFVRSAVSQFDQATAAAREVFFNLLGVK